MSDEKDLSKAEKPLTKRPRGRPRKVQSESIGESIPAAPVKRVRKIAVKTEAAPAPTVTPLKYIFVVGRRKRAVARVFMYHEGQGTIEVNGKPVEAYFPTPLLQMIVSQALVDSPFKSSVKIVAKVRGGGLQGQAVAVRLGIARALIKLDETLRPSFRAKGYLTRDPREKERKKPGLKRARRAPQWQKR